MLTVVLPTGLALIMFSLGLSLTTADFKRIFVQPRGVLIGLVNLFVISPMLAFAIAELYGLEAVMAIGLVLLGASPGGTMANLMTHLARGDTALSISMTAVSSLAAVVTVPLFLGLALSHFGNAADADIEMAGIVARVFLITIIPLSIGMVVRAAKTSWAVANEPKIKRAALIAFVLVVALVVGSEFEEVNAHFGQLTAAVITLNIAAMSLSFLIARTARLDDRQSTAVALELGMHNTTIAIAVGALIDYDYTVPAAMYASFMYVTAGLFARLMARRNVVDSGAPLG